MRLKQLLTASLVLVLVSTNAFSFQKQREIVIYSSYAYQIESRSLQLEKGTHDYEIAGLPAQIIKESIFIVPRAEDINVIFQEYDENVFNFNKLLTEHFGRLINLNLTDNEIISGKLTGFSGSNILIHSNDVLTAVARAQVKSFSIEGIREISSYKPVLRIQINSKDDKRGDFDLHYLTNGIGWAGEYVGFYSPEESSLRIKARANIRNSSGKDYHADKLILVAGEPKRVGGNRPRAALMMREGTKMAAADMAPQFDREEAFIYHQYILNRPFDIGNNRDIQISLFPDKTLKPKEKYIFEMNLYGEKVVTRLEFENNKKDGFGEPVPKGNIKIYSRGKGVPVFLGEDIIPNTPKDEEIKLTLGAAFDLTAKRVLTEYRRIDSRRRDETYEITLTNASDSEKEIIVWEHFGGQWTIINNAEEYEKPDANTAIFTVKVPSKNNTVFQYTVRFN